MNKTSKSELKTNSKRVEKPSSEIVQLGWLVQTLRFNVCDAPEERACWIALTCPFVTSETPHFVVCGIRGATQKEMLKIVGTNSTSPLE